MIYNLVVISGYKYLLMFFIAFVNNNYNPSRNALARSPHDLIFEGTVTNVNLMIN